ncbi:hypothetical protein, partial [Alysiella crassa]|uniref:hypothetical protein n=1 Tax=Alysiella crassa TaxID=153491 RepID=UPI001B802198
CQSCHVDDGNFGLFFKPKTGRPIFCRVLKGSPKKWKRFKILFFYLVNTICPLPLPTQPPFYRWRVAKNAICPR